VFYFIKNIWKLRINNLGTQVMAREDTQWKPGQSGNPSGRSGSTKQSWWNKIVGEQQDEILKKALLMAQNGDKEMIKLVIARAAPAVKVEETIKIKFEGKSFKEQAEEIKNMLANEEINITQANQLMSLLSNELKGIETDEVVKRLEALEERLSKK
jgi:hypothetical protein